ncbi:hypothetical protein JCM11251_001313 [Rhodosporidiobolus azoricus]
MADKEDSKLFTVGEERPSTPSASAATEETVTSPPPASSSPPGAQPAPAPAAADGTAAAEEVTSAPATSESAIPQPAAAPPVDPKVAQLRLLFETVDVEIIEAVLQEKGGNVDAAMDSLLALSDPDYKPENPEELSQLEADEELARALAREDEVASARQRVQQPQPQSLPAPGQPLAYQPYVPRSRRTAGGAAGEGPSSPSIGSWQPPAEQTRQQQQGQQQPERDELDQLTEQFSKFANEGKRLFGGFMARAKEQVGKLDEAIQRSASPTSSQPPAPPSKSASDYSYSSSSSHSQPQWEVPSPLPRPNLHTAGGRHPSATGASESAMPDFSSPAPSPVAAPSSSTASAGATAAAVPSPSTSPSKPPSAFAGKIPGLLPRQSFSLLDPNNKPLSSPSAASPGTAARSPLGASPAALGLAGAAGVGAGAGAGAAAAAASKPIAEEEKSHYSLGDDEDSEDDMEYVRSPFQDDD